MVRVGENEIMREELSERNPNWVNDAAIAGRNGEIDIMVLLKSYLPENEYIVEKKGKRCSIRKPTGGSYILDIAITNISTGLTILIEVKRQHARGNAHERAYKYHPGTGICYYIRMMRKINYYPIITIFTGEMATTPKYVNEITMQYSNTPGAAFLFGSDTNALMSFIDSEIKTRIDGTKTDYNDIFPVDEVIEPIVIPLQPKISLVGLATDEEVKGIIAGAGSNGISKIEIRKLLTFDPSVAIINLRDAGIISIVSGNKKGARWAIVPTVSTQDQTMQPTGT